MFYYVVSVYIHNERWYVQNQMLNVLLRNERAAMRNNLRDVAAVWNFESAPFRSICHTVRKERNVEEPFRSIRYNI